VDGYNGYLVPVQDVDAMASVMEKFITNPELITSMGSAARQIAMDKFDVEAVNKMMLTEMGIQ